MFVRRLLKWFAVLVLLVVVGAVVLVWPVLGVNPFEGRVENLWDVTSIHVDFFARFPAARVLDEPLVADLTARPGFEQIEDLRLRLAEQTAEVARQVNPRIPLGLVEIDLLQDFAGREMAVAGRIQTDFSTMRLDNFLFVTRVAPYARFVSALRRDFVRARIPDARNIEVVKGLYFRLDEPRLAEALRGVRSVRGRPGGDSVFYLARIRDTLLLSDSDLWIEDALQGGVDTLAADAWFDSEFKQTSLGGRNVEVFVRTGLAGQFMLHHTRGAPDTPLGFLGAVLPPPVLGEITLQLSPLGQDSVALRLTDAPPTEGFARMSPTLQRIYDGEKGDLRYELSENGIGRHIPRERTAGAVLVRARAEDLVELVDSLILDESRRLLDDEVRNSSRGIYPSFKHLLVELTEDIADTHLVILHRPSVFETATFDTFKSPGWPPTPAGQFSYTLVTRVKDNVAPDKVREKITRNLQHLGLNAAGVHESGKFHLAEFITEPPNAELIRPAYGVLPAGRYLMLSTSVEAAEAVLRAAEDPAARLLAEPSVLALVERLPAQGSVALVVRGETLHRGLLDHVREYARVRMNVPAAKVRFVEEFTRAGKPLPSDTEVQAEADRYIADTYPRLREQYEEALAWVQSLDAAALAVTLGVGSEKRIESKGFVRFRTGEP